MIYRGREVSGCGGGSYGGQKKYRYPHISESSLIRGRPICETSNDKGL